MLLNTKDIIVENRYRGDESAENITTLADSISNNRLLQPIVVSEIDGKYYLVAGGRRLKAMQTLAIVGTTYLFENNRLDPTTIPVTLTSAENEIERLTDELDENVERSDFEWHEKSTLSKRILLLTRAKLEAEALAKAKLEPKAKPLPVGAKPDVRNLDKDALIEAAKLINDTNSPSPYALRKLQSEVELATAMEDAELRPALARAKSKSEAEKLLIKERRRLENEALATKVGKSFNASSHKAQLGDCLLLSKKIKDNYFDMCITDPPYGINAHKFGKDTPAKLTDHKYDDSPNRWREQMPKWLLMIDRVLKDESTIYMACDAERFFEIKKFIEELQLGWQVQRKPLIHTRKSGHIAIPNFSYRYTYECWLYARKGKVPVQAVANDVMAGDSSGELVHAAQKPAFVFETFLRVSALPGFKVFDPFAGSGSCLPPVHNASCEYWGMELVQEYYGELTNRLKKLKAI